MLLKVINPVQIRSQYKGGILLGTLPLDSIVEPLEIKDDWIKYIYDKQYVWSPMKIEDTIYFSIEKTNDIEDVLVDNDNISANNNIIEDPLFIRERYGKIPTIEDIKKIYNILEGQQGPPGESGIIKGGLPGQIMVKVSDKDGDIEWRDNNPTVDLTNYYDIPQVNEKLETTVKKIELFDEQGKIKAELQPTGVYSTVQELENHSKNTEVHVTNSEKLEWSRKYYVDKAIGIPKIDLQLTVQQTLDNSDTHIVDSDIHTTKEEKAANTAHIANNGIHVTSQDKIDLASAKEHITDTNMHVTTENKAAWNAKYNKPITGIPESDLSSELIAKIGNTSYDDSTVLKLIQDNSDSISTHTNDTNIHVTTENKTVWNAKYNKPLTGIPKTDLDASLIAELDGFLDSSAILDETGNLKQELINDTSGLTSKEVFDAHANNVDIHTTKVEKEANTAHIADTNIHVTTENKAAWNAKYNKPTGGIPKVDLDTALITELDGFIDRTEILNEDGTIKNTAIDRTGLALQADLEGHTSNSDIHTTKVEKEANTAHITDANIHVTIEEKNKWNSSVDLTNINAHIADNGIHVTAQDKTDLASAKEHIADTVIHVTESDKTKWNSMGADFNAVNTHMANNDIHTTKVEKEANTAHIADTAIHVTTENKTAWNAKYDKPTIGIPLADISENALNDLRDHTKLSNKGQYTHMDIDSHMENDLIHNNNSLGKWTFEGQSQMSISIKENIEILENNTAVLAKDVSTEPKGIYLPNGSLTTEVFDTGIEACPFTSLFSFSTYEYGITSLVIKTRTGAVKDPDTSWGEWLQIDKTGKVMSQPNRYIQVKVDLATANLSKTPILTKFYVFYGVNTIDAIKQAQGTYASMDERFKAVEAHEKDTTVHVTSDDKQKIAVIQTNGDGTSYLKNDGTYVPLIGVPAGGTASQLLAKKSNTDGDVEWVTNDLINYYNKTEVDNLVFQNSNSAKSVVLNAIGNTAMSTTNTFQEISNYLLLKKQDIATAITNKGVVTNSTDDLDIMARNINSITHNNKVKNTKLNRLTGQSYQIVMTYPTTLTNICTSMLRFLPGGTNVAVYDCNFDNGDSTSFVQNPNTNIVFDGKMKQNNKQYSTQMTQESSIGGYNVYTATIDKSGFFNISSILLNEDTNTISLDGTYAPELIQPTNDIDLLGVDKLSKLTWTATQSGENKIVLLFSTDSGVTWNGFDSVNNVISPVSDISSSSEILSKGLSITTANALTLTQLEVIRGGSGKIRFAYYIYKMDAISTLENDKITLTVDMKGTDIPSMDYTWAFDGEKTITYTFTKDGTYTIMYTDND